ncbi:MAG: hypothetical protein J7K23_06240 [Thermoproteales archaeon]|nr:hypothetical protein [Thermoproteales archaeon]
MRSLLLVDQLLFQGESSFLLKVGTLTKRESEIKIKDVLDESMYLKEQEYKINL